jgi:hypothetical protein
MNRAHAVTVAALVAVSVTGCKFLDFTEKVDGAIERARIDRDRARGPTALASQGESSPLLERTPPSVDFGVVRIGADGTQTISLTNPAAFVVTVINATVTRPEFSTTVPVAPFDVPAHGQVSLTLMFRPLENKDVSGSLQLELDTAGSRFVRIPLKGRAAKAP